LALLEGAKYLYLREIGEPRDNSLRLVVQEARVNYGTDLSAEEGNGALPREFREAGISKNAYPIESADDCKTFELYWRKYSAYLVTEECVGSSGKYEDEVYTGKLLRHYDKSHFLNHLGRDTGGHCEPLRHYKLVCLNHLIDVAAAGAPEVRVISADAQPSASIH
jgi:hypothetical protein